MAIAVIGGLVTSTLLSLLVIPVAYTYLDDMKAWMLKVWRKLVGDKRGASLTDGMRIGDGL